MYAPATGLMMLVACTALCLVAADKNSAHKAWRIRATAGGYGGKDWGISELWILDAEGKSLVDDASNGGGRPLSSRGWAGNAFDRKSDTYWEAVAPEGKHNWLGYVFREPQAVDRMRIQQYPHPSSRASEAIVEYSDDEDPESATAQWDKLHSCSLFDDTEEEERIEDTKYPCSLAPPECAPRNTGDDSHLKCCLSASLDSEECSNMDGSQSSLFGEGHTMRFDLGCPADLPDMRGGGIAVCEGKTGGWTYYTNAKDKFRTRPPSCGACDGIVCVYQQALCLDQGLDSAADSDGCNEWVDWHEPAAPSTELVSHLGVLDFKILKQQLEDRELDRFQSHGHSNVGGLFMQDELAALRPFVHLDAYWQAKQFYPPISEGGDQQPKEFWLLENGGTFGDGRDTSMAAASAAYKAAMQKLVCSPRLRHAAYQLLQRGATNSSQTCTEGGDSASCGEDEVGSVCVVLNRAFIKDPNDGATHWHRDSDANRLPAEIEMLTAWIPFMPTAPDPNKVGALMFESFSHERQAVEGATERSSEEVEAGLATPTNSSRVVQYPMQVGDVSFHHSRTKHASSPNRSRKLRDAYAVMLAVAEPVSATDCTCAALARTLGGTLPK
jgi:hypothetical protein